MFTLYSSPTPNGWKVSIALEELGLPYKVHPIRLSALEQKEPWFLEINPNGRIPALVDHDAGDFAIFESGAILMWLAEKATKLLPADAKGRSVVLQWLMFQMGGVGPMMGQANVFHRYAPERIPYAIERYQRESRRLLEVLNTRLGRTRFIAGDDYTIADIANWAWVHTYEWSGVDISGLEALERWLLEVGSRPAVVRGRAIPEPLQLGSTDQKSAIVDTARRILS